MDIKHCSFEEDPDQESIIWAMFGDERRALVYMHGSFALIIATEDQDDFLKLKDLDLDKVPITIPTPEYVEGRYKDIVSVKCLATGLRTFLSKMDYASPVAETDEIWARNPDNSVIALLWKGGKFAEIMPFHGAKEGVENFIDFPDVKAQVEKMQEKNPRNYPIDEDWDEKKNARDLLSEAIHYFPLNARVRDIMTGSEFTVRNKESFFLVDDHTVGYLYHFNELNIIKVPKTYAHVYECGKFASFRSIFPEGESIGKEIDMLKKVNEERRDKIYNWPHAKFNMADAIKAKFQEHPITPEDSFKIKIDMEFDENDIQAAVDNILEYPTLHQQNAFWLVVKERIINNRMTEMEELSENIQKEKERIQILKDSLEGLS